MYLSYFGLTEKPFNITPDPRFLYLSEQHREALAHLLFSTDESSSFIVLTGEVGTGKTTLCRSMLEEGVEGNRFALILNPMQSPLELLASACDEFGIAYPAKPGIKNLVDALNRWLLARNADNEQAILIIDEAQNLSFETLEQIRLLTNLETGSKKLLKIILIGQPELREMLDRPELRQLSQRVTARYHLAPMTAPETTAYVLHRLKVAGARRALFTTTALKRIHRLSGGIPRRINLIADRALTGAYARQRHIVDSRIVTIAARELSRGANTGTPTRRRLPWFAIIVVITALALPLLAWLRQEPPPAMPKPQASQAEALDDREYIAALEAAIEAEQEEAATTQREKKQKKTAPQTPIGRLLALWGATLDPGDATPACDQAARQGLACLLIKGDFDDLLSLDRPALIEVHNDAGEIEHWLIRAMRKGDVLIDKGGDEATLTRDRLASVWPGRFLLLWHAPPSGGTMVHGNSPATDKRWLRARLERAGVAVEGNDLEAAIRRFQRRNGLVADGKAGIRTLLALETQSSETTVPTLR